MRQIYPSKSARKGNVLADGSIYYCEQCGFPCNKDKVMIAKRDTRVGDTITITTDGEQPTNIQVNAGCPFCGTPRSKR